MITYYEKPFKEQAHIHSLDGKMGEITKAFAAPRSLTSSPAHIMPTTSLALFKVKFDAVVEIYRCVFHFNFLTGKRKGPVCMKHAVPLAL